MIFWIVKTLKKLDLIKISNFCEFRELISHSDHIDWWPTVRGDCTWSNKDGLQKCTFEHIYSCPSVRLSNLCKLKNFEVMDYSYQNTTLVLPSCKNWKTTKSMMSLVQTKSTIKIMWQQSFSIFETDDERIRMGYV